jgi:uncharacterized protein YyaL (SSP411 family)
VKVDREERPDLDDVYMAATLALNRGQGGWPMTVFLTPERQPFFAGTYFPPDDRWGRPGFPTLLRRIAQAWRTLRGNLTAQASEVVDHLRSAAPAAGTAVGADAIAAAQAQLAADFDPRFAGFGPAPKFPPSAALALLLRAHRRTGDGHALEMAWRTLDAPWRTAASTTRSAAASTATPSTSAGWCRTSRRCSTTTRSSPARTSRRGR